MKGRHFMIVIWVEKVLDQFRHHTKNCEFCRVPFQDSSQLADDLREAAVLKWQNRYCALAVALLPVGRDILGL